jgi:quercetin dioxygenase-like cupin family protein
VTGDAASGGPQSARTRDGGVRRQTPAGKLDKETRMGKGDYYPAVKGKTRAQYLKRFEAQMKKWGTVVPKVKPLVINFGGHDFNKEGLIELWIANEEKEGYCGKYLFVFEGQTCPYHHHPFKHETFYVMKGSVSMNVNGRKRVLKEGQILAMAQKTKHSFTGLGGPALLLEVSKPCVQNDNLFEDPTIGVI